MLICVLSCLLLAGCALSDGGDASIANTDGTESRFDGAQAQNPGSASAEHMESTGRRSARHKQFEFIAGRERRFAHNGDQSVTSSPFR